MKITSAWLYAFKSSAVGKMLFQMDRDGLHTLLWKKVYFLQMRGVTSLRLPETISHYAMSMYYVLYIRGTVPAWRRCRSDRLIGRSA